VADKIKNNLTAKGTKEIFENKKFTSLQNAKSNQ